MVTGLVRKKKPRVMWNREREGRMVRADMRAIFAGLLRCQSLLLPKEAKQQEQQQQQAARSLEAGQGFGANRSSSEL